MATETRLKTVTIQADGACEGNPGPGGWAALLRYGQHARELTGSEAATTNPEGFRDMGLQAAIASDCGG